MFAVCFERNDDKPNEEYFYQKKEDAEYHFSLFENDDSGLYKRIAIIEFDFPSEEDEIFL